MACGKLMCSVVATAVLAAGCAGDDATGEGDDATTSAPTTTVAVTVGTLTPSSLPDCPADAVDVPSDWPYAVPAGVVPTAIDSDETHFDLTGTTNDPDGTVESAIATSFQGFDATSPTGSATELSVGFSAPVGDAQMVIADDDGDGCWDVAIDSTFIEVPASTTPGTGPDAEPPATTTPEQAALAEAYESAVAVGTGEIITARGSFPLRITRCDPGAALVEAIAAEGELTVTAVDDERFSVEWTYADGTVIADDAASAIGRTQDTANLVANGEGPDGPESLVIDLACSVP